MPSISKSELASLTVLKGARRVNAPKREEAPKPAPEKPIDFAPLAESIDFQGAILTKLFSMLSEKLSQAIEKGIKPREPRAYRFKVHYDKAGNLDFVDAIPRDRNK